MPRTSRASVGGICYHVINRGNNRATVFFDGYDYRGVNGDIPDWNSKESSSIRNVPNQPSFVHG